MFLRFSPDPAALLVVEDGDGCWDVGWLLIIRIVWPGKSVGDGQGGVTKKKPKIDEE